MSIEAIHWALNAARPPRDRRDASSLAMVLVGLANYADPDGCNAFPSLARLARYTRLSERSVRYALRALEELGLMSVEFYSAYALRILLASDRLSECSRRFARRSFLASMVVGGGAQIASHIMAAAHVASAPWPVTTVVACVPLLVIGLATGLATLVKRDANTGGDQQ